MGQYKCSVDALDRSLYDALICGINYFNYHRNFGFEVTINRVDDDVFDDIDMDVIETFKDKYIRFNKNRMNFFKEDRVEGTGYKTIRIFES